MVKLAKHTCLTMCKEFNSRSYSLGLTYFWGQSKKRLWWQDFTRFAIFIAKSAWK